MDSVYVIGVGMIRFNKYPDRTVQSMAHEAIELVLKDAVLMKKKKWRRGIPFEYLLGDV